MNARSFRISLLAIAFAVAGCGEKAAETAIEIMAEAAAARDGQSIDFEIDGDTITVKTNDGTTELTIDAERGVVSIVSDEGNVRATADDQGSRFESDDGTILTGDQAKLPDDFPEDVPLYPGLKLNVVSDMQNGAAIMVQGEVDATIEEISAYYEKEAADQGWTTETEMKQPQMAMYIFKKDGRTMQVLAVPEDDGVSLSVTIQTE